jgi:hypothetical protein
MMPIESKLEAGKKEDGGGDITCIGKNRLPLTNYHRSLPFLETKKRREKKRKLCSLRFYPLVKDVFYIRIK